ncbi:MAG: SDR family NAD(P)-dependent oxidoreductase [Verrucomicrobiaceae bacterium]|nr:MAG: SDR family NAD(P)-dependent oxidoreductase [Verrucomicrobiaceae bacterium]
MRPHTPGTLARQLAARGFRVYVGARNREAGEKAVEALGGNVQLLHLDVASEESIQNAVHELNSQTDKLDVLVNNAGIVLDYDKSLFDLTADTLRKTLETNLFGALLVSQAVMPLMRKSATPRIVNVSSGAGQLSGELQSWAPGYSISKTALNALTEQLAAALPKFAVNSVCPGWVRTDMGGPNATRSVEEGADTIVWLAADASQELTGKNIRDRQVIEW